MRFVWCLLLSLSIAGLSQDAKALLIDDFNNGTTDITANAGTTTIQTVEDVAGVLGGQREVTALWTGPAGNTSDLSVSIGGGAYNHGQGPGVRGMSFVVYDGDADVNVGSVDIDETGLGGVDLTAGGSYAFALDLLFADLTGADVVGILVYSDAANSSFITRNISAPVNAPPITSYVFPYAEFVVGSGAGADFSNVGAIVLIVDGRFEPALDVTIDQFTTVVPEPASIVLLGIGLSCVGMRRMRSRRQG